MEFLNTSLAQIPRGVCRRSASTIKSHRTYFTAINFVIRL